MTRQLDVLFINPNSAKAVYQDLAETYTAIEVPVWSLLLAQSCRSVGFGVAILDCDAERLNDIEAAKRVQDADPRLIVFVVYGQNPNSGSTNMIGAVRLARFLKAAYPNKPIAFIGSHTSALPNEVLNYDFVDFIFYNEGVYGLRELLATDLKTDLDKISNLGFKKDDLPLLNTKSAVVLTEKMDVDLPGYAWDLLPFKSKPLDLYRSHFWHGEFDHNKCTPAAAIYTSLGCQFACQFCLDGNTKITLSRHKNKIIKDIEIGDKLVAWDEKKLCIVETCVTKLSKRTVNQILEIKLADGKIIKTTAEHPFYIEGQWVAAGNVKIGDNFLVIDSSDKISLRMKLVNPMYNQETRNKVSATTLERIASGENVPYLSTERGKRQISTIAREKMLSDKNPMLQEHNQEKARKRFVGSNNPRWNNGSCEKLRPYYLNRNKKLRQKIKKRDNYTCQECGKTEGKIDAHHIDYNKYNNIESNLITLCASCHTKTNFDRAFWQKRYTKYMMEHYNTCPHHVRVEEIRVILGEFIVYNIECLEYNNFFANNILTHNCMINIVNRNSPGDGIHAANSNMMRFWSPDFIFQEFKKLVDMGVETVRISDEMFFLNRKYFEPLLNKIVESDLGKHLRMWTYSRIDTVRPRFLELFRKAGVKWLALGVESANTAIRREITKGSFEEIDIRQVVKEIYDSGIYTIANYIYGLPTDTYETMQYTYDLSVELNTEMMNCYGCMALPGSPLYYEAKNKGYPLPQSFSEWSFLSYDSLPMPTEHLTSTEVIRFRDEAWQKYFTRPEYLTMVENRVSRIARENIEKMTKLKLKRKLLGD